MPVISARARSIDIGSIASMARAGVYVSEHGMALIQPTEAVKRGAAYVREELSKLLTAKTARYEGVKP